MQSHPLYTPTHSLKSKFTLTKVTSAPLSMKNPANLQQYPHYHTISTKRSIHYSLVSQGRHIYSHLYDLHTYLQPHKSLHLPWGTLIQKRLPRALHHTNPNTPSITHNTFLLQLHNIQASIVLDGSLEKIYTSSAQIHQPRTSSSHFPQHPQPPQTHC